MEIGIEKGKIGDTLDKYYIYVTTKRDKTMYHHNDGVWRTIAIANETSAYFYSAEEAKDCLVDFLVKGKVTKKHKAYTNQDRNKNDNSV